jgi:hypothetical protein
MCFPPKSAGPSQGQQKVGDKSASDYQLTQFSKKTLEKLNQNGNPTSSLDSEGRVWKTLMGTSQSPIASGLETLQGALSPRQTSPFDTFLSRPLSPVDNQSGRPSKKARHNSDTLANLEKSFPTDAEMDGDEPLSCQISSPQKDLQNPLLFLAECSRRGWDSRPKKEPLVIPLPTTSLPLEDQRLLEQWQVGDIQNMVRDQKTFFQHGLYGIKRDVSAGLDAVQRGIIPEDQVEELFARYVRRAKA